MLVVRGGQLTVFGDSPFLPPREWLTFLRNHREVLTAMDFFTVPTATLRILYVWFVIHHDRKILHFNVTEHPSAAWVFQQLALLGCSPAVVGSPRASRDTP